jgi:hypothetical protein
MVLLIIGIILLVFFICLCIYDKYHRIFYGEFTIKVIIFLFFLLAWGICSLITVAISESSYALTPIEDMIVSTETWSAVWNKEASDYIILNDDNKLEGVLSDYKNITVSNEIDSIEVYNDIYVFYDLDWLGGPLSHHEGNRVRIIIPVGD